MNIVLFINKDLESALAYNLLKKELSKHNYRIYYSENVGKASNKPQALQKLEYFEKDFFFGSIKDYIEKNRIASSFDFLDPSISSVPIAPCTNPNTSVFIDQIKAFEPDLFLSIRFGKIFKNEIIRVPTKGILNLHSAILPDYRGILGTLHALKNGDEHVGCTLHYISDGTIDTGEIIEIAKLKVQPEKSLFWHVASLYPLGCNMILQSLKKLDGIQRLDFRPQDMSQGSYFSLPTEEDFKQLKSEGMDVISKNEYLAFLQKWVAEGLDSDLFE